jgi:hypothetical protein
LSKYLRSGFNGEERHVRRQAKVRGIEQRFSR